MTPKLNIAQERLESSLEKCRLHLKRLNYAFSVLDKIRPITKEEYQSITDEEIGHIDQLIFRFSKLQDEIGNHTFRFLLEYLQEDIENKPFRDLLHLLEKFGIIDSPETWLSLREIRNDLTHEYPTMIEETVNKLNVLFEKLPELENILKNIEREAKK